MVTVASRLIGAFVVLALVAGCDQPTPTPVPAIPAATLALPSTPSAVPTASATTAPSPSPTGPAAAARTYQGAGEIGDVLFPADGRIILVERDWTADRSRVVALDGAGAVLPGWPWTQGDTGDPIATAALGPDGSLYVAVRGAQGIPETYTWTLHRLDTQAAELPGFPVVLPDVPFCALTVGAGGIAYASCERDNEATGTTTTMIRAVRPDGMTVVGWPIAIGGSGSIAGFRPDGALVIAVGGPSATITAVLPDGSTAKGWPRSAPDGDTVVVDAAGRVHVTAWDWSDGECGPATRTTYTVLGLDGTTAPGWPIKLKGWASEPLVVDDGSMTIVTGDGRAIRYGRDGTVADGWPVKSIGVDVGCYSGSRPVATGAGRVVVLGHGRATLLSAGGRIAGGWPVRLPYAPAIICPDCTPGPTGPLDPAVGKRGIYVAAYRADRPRLMALDRDGTLPKARQHAFGKVGDTVEWLRAAPDGRIWALLTRWSDEAQATMSFLVPVAEDHPAGG